MKSNHVLRHQAAMTAHLDHDMNVKVIVKCFSQHIPYVTFFQVNHDIISLFFF